jgi:beta-mannosidase
MNRKNPFLLSIMCLITLAAMAQTSPHSLTELKDNWNMQRFGQNVWVKATVPGCVHTDLIANHLIKDPFYRDNEKSLQWIDKYSWVYATTFTVDNTTANRQNIELNFKGLDTYADVYVNDKLLLSADNMFINWHVNIKPVIREGENTLRVFFHSPVVMGLLLRDKWNIEPPMGFNFDFGPGIPNITGAASDFPAVGAYTRKAGYMYGWDWSPRLTTSGIWKPVYLEAWNDARIENVQIVQREINPTSASITEVIEISSASAMEASLTLGYSCGNLMGQALPVTVQLKAGLNRIEMPKTIPNPKIWWPNGLGDHPVYAFQATLSEQGRTLDQLTTKTGLRTVKLVTKPDQYGESFYFEINGIPVFAKGADMVPTDIFPSRTTPEHYRTLISSAADAHINMLRVWGGGIYESDLFYDLCDEYGIMIWQDFAFAINIIPNDEANMHSIRQELTDNIRRMRNHPSIVLWCGNNETEMIWDIFTKGLFGFKTEDAGVDFMTNILKMLPKVPVKPETTEAVMKAYDDIFYGLIPEVVKQEDLNNRPYRTSSPIGGWKVPSNMKSGDMHFYVAYVNAPFEIYYTLKSRFFSEHGFQAFPDFNTVKKFSVPEDWNYLSPVMQHHQRASGGNQVLDKYMRMYYKYPKDFETYLYVSQLMQADVMKMSFETHRKWRPYTMGTLYWQLNDVWPVASWSSMDYMNHWKALHYQVKRSFADVILTPTWFKDTLTIHLVSDVPKPVKGTLEVKIIDLNGKELKKFTQPVNMEGNASRLLVTRPGKALLSGIDTTNAICVVHLYNGKQVLTENHCFFTANKNLNLAKNTLTTKITPSGDSYTIEVSTTSFARGVYLSTESEGFFSDNYFDLMPGEKKTITYTPQSKITGLEGKLKVFSLADTY